MIGADGVKSAVRRQYVGDDARVTGHVVYRALSSREMGRLYHAKGVERLVRNELWKGRTPERFYDALE